MEDGPGRHRNRTLSRGFGILELVAASTTGITVGALAEKTGLDKGTTSRLVSALQDLGYLYRREDRRIVLTGRVMRLTSGHEAQFDLKRIARPYLERLCGVVKETVNLSVRQGTHVLYVDQFDPDRQLRLASQIGRMTPLHDTAMGRSMLFALDIEPRRELLRALAFESEEEPGLALDEAGVERELAVYRRTGFVTLPRNDDLARAAAPIVDDTGRPLAAVGVYGPAYRMRRHFRDIGKACRVTADQISEALAGAQA